MKISDQLVQLFMEEEWDKTPLSRESFPVNMRLYRVSSNYREIILALVRYMDEHLRTTFEDYPEPRGVAAANLGFPFKIIGYKKKPCENQFCLNPKITHRSVTMMSGQTNCGSLRLEQPLSIERHLTIDFEYYDLEGNLVMCKNVARGEGGFTVQNAIDSCNGLTIMGRYEKDKKKK